MAEILGFIQTFGLPLVLLIILGYAYKRKEDQHEIERSKWQEALTAEREKCGEERVEWDREREKRAEHERLVGEKNQSLLLETQKMIIEAINKASEMAAMFNQEKKEIRDARERELRDTGQYRPAKPPAGGR